MEIAGQDLQLSGGKIRVYTAGTSGPPVVLLHGGGLDAALISWRHAIAALAKGYRVYAFDWPKQGESTGWDQLMDTKALVAVLEEILDRLALDRVSLVGLSMGSAAAIGFALMWPKRVNAMVLANPGGLQRRIPYHTLAWLMLKIPSAKKAGMPKSKDDLKMQLESRLFTRTVPDIDQVVEDVWQERQRRTSALSDFQVAELGAFGVKVNFMPRLGEISQPTLIIHGQEDSLVPVDVSREAVLRLQNGEIHEIESAGHWPNREAPDEFNGAMVAFLNRVLKRDSANGTD